MPVTPRILLIGYGNPGRGDDGLGPALAEEIAAMGLPGVTVDIDYQLTVDHAALIASHDAVVFADAALGLDEPFRLTPVRTSAPQALGSHQLSPEAALHLAALLFGHAPKGWILALAGERFDRVHEGLGMRAKDALALATPFLSNWLVEVAAGRQHLQG